MDSSQQPTINISSGNGSGNATQEKDPRTTTSPLYLSSTPVTASPYTREIQFDIDGSFSTEFNNKLIVSNNENDTTTAAASSAAATTTTTTTTTTINNDIFDNLTVIPDTARPSALYISQNTNLLQFQQNGIGCEQKLSVEIFGSRDDNNGDNDAGRNNGSSFKVSCAICLLTNHYQNGFVAIVSNSLKDIQPLLMNARNNAAARIKSMNSLHSDHAHFVCALKISTVRSFISSSGGNRTTRSSRSVLIKQISNQMVESGVVLLRDAQSFMESDATTTAAAAKIEIGHHLTSFIQLWTEKDTNTNNSNDDQPASALLQYPYIMVIGYHDTNSQWTLDLPGGKRHLGENTFQCAIREVEEECSLQLNQEWMEGRVPIEYGGLLASDVVPPADGCDGGVVTVLESFGDAFIVLPASLDVIVGNG
jgi:hypothetical protein